MLNLNEVSGVKSSPISKNILENSIGNNTLKDSRAYSNYEFLLDSIENGSFRAPSVILASGSGGFYPKTAEYQNNFYSAHIYGRDDYLNSWQESYRTDEAFELTYYDGSTLFREFKIDPGTGRGKIKSLETRNGNLPGQAGFTQFIMGYNADASVDDVGYYRHNFRTRHSSTNNNENAIDVFLWDSSKDSKTALGSRRVISLYGNGNFELVSGTSIFGPVNIAIGTTAEKTAEKDALAVAGKGVIYYNESKNRFRYSENGGEFKYFGSGGGTFVLESCNLNKTMRIDPPEIISNGPSAYSEMAFVTRFYSPVKAKIKRIYIPGVYGGSLKVGVYRDDASSSVGSFRCVTERLMLSKLVYANGDSTGNNPGYTLDVNVDDDWLRSIDRSFSYTSDAIVDGNFAIAIGNGHNNSQKAESIYAEMMPEYSLEGQDNTVAGTSHFNFKFMMYDSNDTEILTNTASFNDYDYAIGHEGVAGLLSGTIRQNDGNSRLIVQTKIPFIPYIMVILETVE